MPPKAYRRSSYRAVAPLKVNKPKKDVPLPALKSTPEGGGDPNAQGGKKVAPGGAAHHESSPEDGDHASAPTFRKLVAHYMATSVMGVVMDLLSTIFALISCILYIFSTYRDDICHVDEGIEALEVIMTVFFAFDYVLRAGIASRPIAYLLSSEAIVDLLALLPIIDRAFDCETKQRIAVVLGILRVMRILRIYRITRLLEYQESQVTKAIAKMILTIITAVIFVTGLIQIIENDYAASQDGIYAGAEKLPFHFYFYFLMVTVSTVGYGDYSPNSTQGQMICIIIIFAGIIYVSNASSEAIRLAGLTSPYARAKYKPHKGVPHIVVCGEFTESSLRDFFTEVFHKDHGNIDLQLVLLNPVTPTNEIKTLISHPRYSLSVKYVVPASIVVAVCVSLLGWFNRALFLCPRADNRVFLPPPLIDALIRSFTADFPNPRSRRYLEGSPMKEVDLGRAALAVAKCAFVLTNKYCHDVDGADASTILQALSIKRYVRRQTGKEILQCMQLMRAENKHHFTSFCDEPSETGGPAHRYCIVCVEEIKMKLLAQTCLCPGLVTLMSNLVSSTDEEPLGKDTNAQEWISEYQEGSGYEVYTKPVPATFSGVPFCEVALCVYEVLGACMFALEIRASDNSDPRIVLNPGDYPLPDVNEYKVRAFLFAEDDETADLSHLGGSFAPRATGKPKPGSPIKSGTLSSESREQKGSPKASPLAKKSSGHWAKIKGANDGAAKAIANKKARRMDMENLKIKYFIREEAAQIGQVTVVRSLEEDLPGVIDHLIIAGAVENLFEFILTLRAKHLGHIQTILILHPHPPDAMQWEKISMFPQVVYMQGSALNNKDLMRAGVMKASHAVVFAPIQESGTSVSNKIEAMLDANTIFIYQGILALNPDMIVVTELVSCPNMAFLSPDMSKTQKSANSNPLASAQFASGAAYTSSMLDTLVCQAFYNPHIVTVLQQLVAGSDPEETARWDKEWEARGNTEKITDSHLYQIPVPKQFHGKTYGSLVEWLLLTRGMMPLGLYRGTWSHQLHSGPKGNRIPYVYTNPDKGSSLESCDAVFVLAQFPPEDLLAQKRSVADVMDSLQRARKLSTALKITAPAKPGPLTSTASPMETRGGSGGLGSAADMTKLIGELRSVVRSEVQGIKGEVESLAKEVKDMKAAASE